LILLGNNKRPNNFDGRLLTLFNKSEALLDTAGLHAYATKHSLRQCNLSFTKTQAAGYEGVVLMALIIGGIDLSGGSGNAG
jgi:hypothetical protein